jgi:hypothetical protein
MYPLLFKKSKVNGMNVCPVVLTSFEIPLREKKLRKVKWSYIVVDEGHRLKNYKCLLARYTKSRTALETFHLYINYATYVYHFLRTATFI